MQRNLLYKLTDALSLLSKCRYIALLFEEETGRDREERSYIKKRQEQKEKKEAALKKKQEQQEKREATLKENQKQDQKKRSLKRNKEE